VVKKFFSTTPFCLRYEQVAESRFDAISLRKRREKRACVNAFGSSPWDRLQSFSGHFPVSEFFNRQGR